ncbi:MAG: hypothetical protein JSR59_19050 [Proteobacteria bacterium]|nr:hypothetical protein [Pseudomonadota bacterium]
MKEIFAAAAMLVLCAESYSAELFVYQAPDREQLMSPADRSALGKLRSDKHIASAYPIVLDFAAFADSELTLRLPDGQSVTCSLTKAVTYGMKSWAGEIPGGGSCIFSYEDSSTIAGHFNVGKRYFDIIVPTLGTFILTELIPRRYNEDGDTTPPAKPSSSARASDSRPAATASSASQPIIRVFTVWADSVIPTSQVSGQTNALLFNLNAALTRSGVNAIAVNAGWMIVPTSPNYGGSVGSALVNMVGDNSIINGRNEHLADVTMLVYASPTIDAGLSDAAPAAYNTAFAVVDYNAAFNNFSYEHEFGHLLGGQHQISGGISNYPSLSPKSYQHGYGFSYTAGGTLMNRCVHDIMAVPMQACDRGYDLDLRQGAYASPSYIWPSDGVQPPWPLGDATYSDVARTMSEQAPSTAMFHAARIAPLPPVVPPQSLMRKILGSILQFWQ